jgi:hypothetical protein
MSLFERAFFGKDAKEQTCRRHEAAPESTKQGIYGALAKRITRGCDWSQTGLTSERKDAEPRTRNVDRDNCAVEKLVVCFADRRQYCRAHRFRRKQVTAQLENARAPGACCGQDRRKIQVVRQHDMIVFGSPTHDITIIGIPCAICRPMDGLYSGCGEKMDLPRRQNHIDQDSHPAAGRSISRSCVRQAA